MQNKTNHYCTC